MKIIKNYTTIQAVVLFPTPLAADFNDSRKQFPISGTVFATEGGGSDPKSHKSNMPAGSNEN